MNAYQSIKATVWDFYNAFEKAAPADVAATLAAHVAPDYHTLAVYPFDRLVGPDAAAETLYVPLKTCFTGLQRRPFVFLAGTSEVDDTDWVASLGHFMGLFDHDWLGIPATGRLACLRYADFHCVEKGKITRSAFFCDIIDLMQQAGVNPLPSSTGAPGIWPPPKTMDGLLHASHDPEQAAMTLALIDRMVEDLNALNKSGEDRCTPDYLARTWRGDMGWYGPAGIGATYTIPRYQQQHQRPFRQGVQQKVFNEHVSRVAEGSYGGFFGWPNLTHSPVGGFLGLPGSDTRVDMRVVDFYRREGDRLAENWIIIDLPWWLKQQGLDVFERLQSLRSAPQS